MHRVDPLTGFFSELTAWSGFNLIYISFLILNVLNNSLTSQLLFAISCLEPFANDRVKLPPVDRGAFDRRIDCMYLYFTGKKKKAAASCLRVRLPINVLHDCWRGNVSHFHMSAGTRLMLFQVSNGTIR